MEFSRAFVRQAFKTSICPKCSHQASCLKPACAGVRKLTGIRLTALRAADDFSPFAVHERVNLFALEEQAVAVRADHEGHLAFTTAHARASQVWDGVVSHDVALAGDFKNTATKSVKHRLR